MEPRGKMGLPRVITAKAPILDMPPPRMTREERRQEKREEKERRKVADAAMEGRGARRKRRRSDRDSGSDDEERSDPHPASLRALEDQQAEEFVDPDREAYDPMIQTLNEIESSMQQSEPAEPSFQLLE